MRTMVLALGLLAAQGSAPPPRVLVYSGSGFSFHVFDGVVTGGVLKANIPAPIPGPIGPPGAASTVPGPPGPTGPAGAPGAALVGQSCVSQGEVTLMVKLPNNTCLPLVVVTGDGLSAAVIDSTGISYKPSGWKLAGIVVP